MSQLHDTVRDDLTVRVAHGGNDHLGEGPHWDQRNQELIRVDITSGFVHRWDPATDRQVTLRVGAPVSFAIPCEHGGLVVGGKDAVRVVGDNFRELVLAKLDTPASDIRFNDAKCDQRGRLWAGTMSTTRRAGAAALYRLEPGGELEPVIEGTTISNGIGWSPAGDCMYFIDSTTQRIDAFDFDLSTGEINARRTFVAIERADGLPDGLAVDREGGVWVCLFGGRVVRRYGRDGELTAQVQLPVSNPTCPVFAGHDLGTVYVTTARHRLTGEQLVTQPLAGAVFAVEPGVSGLSGHRFAG